MKDIIKAIKFGAAIGPIPVYVQIFENRIKLQRKYELDEMKLHKLARATGFKNVAESLGVKLEADKVKDLLDNFSP